MFNSDFKKKVEKWRPHDRKPEISQPRCCFKDGSMVCTAFAGEYREINGVITADGTKGAIGLWFCFRHV